MLFEVGSNDSGRGGGGGGADAPTSGAGSQKPGVNGDAFGPRLCPLPGASGGLLIDPLIETGPNGFIIRQ